MGRWGAGWNGGQRDVRVLTHVFPWRGAALLGVWLVGTGILFVRAYNRAFPDAPLSAIKALFAPFNLALLQVSYPDMPPGPELDHFFVLVPLVGIPLFWSFGVQLVQALRILFVRAERGQQWQVALAATVRRPIVICGLGRVGYRVARQLLDLGEAVVGIEAADSPLVRELIDADLPVIMGDARQAQILRQAGIADAKAVIVCTNDDWVNLHTALRIRELNAQTRLVLRLFDEHIGEEIRGHLAVNAIISRSALAAVTLANAALGSDVVESFRLNGRDYALARLQVEAHDALCHCQVGDLTDRHDATVVYIERANALMLEPAATMCIQPGDVLLVFAAAEQLPILAQAQTSPGDSNASRIVVCGLGHTGYWAAEHLRRAGCTVTGLAQESDALTEELAARGVRVLLGDCRQPAALAEAGVADAAAIVLCAGEDLVNLEAALRARALNPHLRVVIGLLDEDLGETLRHVFGFAAVYSTSAIASPHFVAAALDRVHIGREAIHVQGESYSLARLQVETGAALVGQSLAALNAEPGLTVLLHRRDGQIAIPPDLAAHLRPRDEIVTLASAEALRHLHTRNKAATARSAR